MHVLYRERAFCYDCTRIGPVLKLIIEDDEGRKTVVPFVRDEITIGRQEGNTIRLTERNVSRRHARLVRLNGHVVVEDLGSYNGTRINGERIAGQSPLKTGDLVQIGDYDLALQAEGAPNAVGPITTKVPARRPEPEPDEDDDSGEHSRDDEAEESDHTPPSLSASEMRRHSTSIIRLDQVEADRPRKVVDVPAEDAPRLLVLSPDELKGQEFACIRTELRIGRTDDNDITLDHRSLSRTHAKLVREDSGEWRVIDMQSANGMTVNGESYAQATLSTGDVIELGHVKLRFISAGDVTDDLAAGGGSRSKLPLVAGFVALLLGGGGAAVYFMNQQGMQSPTPVVVAEPPEPATARPAIDTPPTPADDEPVGNEAHAAATPPKPETPPPPRGPSLEEQRAVADKAIAARDFDTAVAALEVIKDANGQRPREIETRLDEARAEQLMKRRLDEARQALGDGKLSDADEALRESAGTKAFAREYAALKAQVAEAQKKAATAAAAAAAAKAPPEPPPQSAAAKLQEEGLALLKVMRYRQAIERLEKCIEVEPGRPECHLYLGSAYAKDNQPDKGAMHYMQFLELAPNHPQYEKVKGFVDGYKSPKK